MFAIFRRQNVRRFAAMFLQELMVAAPALPTEDEYKVLRKEHRAKLDQQISMERAAASAAALLTQPVGTNASRSAFNEWLLGCRRLIPCCRDRCRIADQFRRSSAHRLDRPVSRRHWLVDPITTSDGHPTKIRCEHYSRYRRLATMSRANTSIR